MCLRLAPFVVLLTLLLGAGDSQAQPVGTWFDIGTAKEIYVHSPDALAHTYFPPLPFGPTYPPGTIVYARLDPIACEVIASLSYECDTTPVVTSYVAFFNDGGCGCGGYLAKPITLRIAYDPEIVSSLSGTEEGLTVIHYDWDLLSWVVQENVVIHPDDNYLEVTFLGWILAEQYFVVLANSQTPVEPTTWGTLKSQW